LQFVYAGTSGKHLKKVIGTIGRELRHLQHKGLTKTELEYYRTQIIGSLVLEADDIDNRMNSLGYNEMVHGEYRTVDHAIADLQKVTVDSMNVFLKKYFDISKPGVIVIGDVSEDRTESLVKSALEF
jgi:predicted Zn-dependent peptidase